MAASTTETFERSLEELSPVNADDALRKQIVNLLTLMDSASAKCKLIGETGEEVEIPEALFRILAHAARVLARGEGLIVVPLRQLLTTRQAAEVLNVSRQYLVRLLDENRLPFTRTGTHRRIRLDDVLAFKEKRDRKRRQSLKKLTELSEEFGGYEELE